MKQQLTIAMASELEAERLYRRIAAAEAAGDEKGCKVELTGTRLTIALRSIKGGHSDESMFRRIVSGLAEYIVDEMEADLLLRIIRKSDIDGKADASKLARYCREMLDGTENALTEDGAARGRKAKLCEQLHNCISEYDYVDLNGVIAFRLKSYIAELTDTVSYAIDEYVLNRQYQEFIALLKYFVFFQETKMDEAHLIHQGENRFVMLDGSMKPLEALGAEDVVVETVDQELNYEDMVVSSLIAASPERIHIHTRQPETAAIQTISQIFEGRTTVCQGCVYCATIGERIKP